MDRFRTALCEMIESPIVGCLGADQLGLRQFGDCLLQFKISCVPFIQYEFRYLGSGERKINFVQHIEYD